MRTIKELLVLLKEVLPRHEEYWFKYSLCLGASGLMALRAISVEECAVLINYIEDHKPDDADADGDFWWPVDNLDRRIEFLDGLINELKEE